MSARQFQPEQLERLYEVARSIHASLEPVEALQWLVQESVQLVGASSGSLALVNPTTGLLEIEAAVGLPEAGSSLTLRLGEGITGWVVQHGLPLRIGDVAADDRYITARPDVRSELAVPVH